MTLRNGKPCKRCGTSDWYTSSYGCKECQRIRTTTQEYKAVKAAYQKTPRGKSIQSEYAKTPKAKAYAAAYDRTPKMRAYHAAYAKTKAAKEIQAAYSKSPRGKASKSSSRAKRRTMKSRSGGSYTGQDWQELQNHYDNRCLKCGRDDVPMTADHIIAVDNGGSSNIDNIQPLCKSCNSSKGKRHSTDYRKGNFITRWIQDKLL